MGFQLFDPNPYPSVNMMATLGFKVLVSNFGDNYSQRAGDGINALADMMDVSWDNLTIAEYNTIYNFLIAQGGVQPFYFQKVGQVTWQKWTCNDPIKTSFVNGQNASLQASFKEVFDVDPNVVIGYSGEPVNALKNSLGIPVIDTSYNYVLTS